MKKQNVPQNFIYPEIKETDYRFGSGALVGAELRPDGDWRDYLPPEEDQRVNGVESSACYVEASQHAIATLQEETFDIKDQNYSARFNALLSGGTVLGGDPLKGAESIRKDGLVKQESMPWEGIDTWNEFHSFAHVDIKSVHNEGKDFLNKWKLGYDVVFTRNESLKAKQLKLKQALKYSPCPVSVTAWYEENGEYVKPDGSNDNHLTMAMFMDEQGRIHVWDTYAPYHKVLSANYNPDFCMRWAMEKRDLSAEIPVILKVIDTLKRFFLLHLFPKWLDEFVKPTMDILEPFPIDLQEELAKQVEKSIATDASPLDLVSDEYGCAESLAAIIHTVVPYVPTGILSTAQLATVLDDCKQFERALEPKRGTIIISPRTLSTFGHCGVFVDGSTIVSNDSKTGTMQKNYTWNEWIQEYRFRRKLRILMWNVKVGV